ISAYIMSVCLVSLIPILLILKFFFFQAEDGIRDRNVTGVQTCALPILSSSIVSVFRNLNGQLRNAGRNAMIGLQNGMNSRRGSVMSTARGIANSVSSTMRRALKIKSPSRITMAIGEFVGQGLAKGLE